MEIRINQASFSFTDKYNIYAGAELQYTAASVFFSWPKRINLYEAGSSIPKLILQKNFSLSDSSFDLTKDSGEILEFRSQSFWKAHYSCPSGDDLYEIFGHKGRKYSVFKNDLQIAWWDKNAISFGTGDKFVITTNKESDHALIIAFCLVIDERRDSDSAAVTIDIGNIGPEERKFDSSWRPK